MPRALLRTLGILARSLGAAFESAGKALQASSAPLERLSRHRPLQPFLTSTPTPSPSSFVAPSATLSGSINLSSSSSIWYTSTILNSMPSPLLIGDRAAILPSSTISSTPLSPSIAPPHKSTTPAIAADALISSGAILSAASVGPGSFVGANAILLPGSSLSPRAALAPCSVLPEGTTIPEGELWAGNPAVFIRKLEDAEIARIAQTAKEVEVLAGVHKRECEKKGEEIEGDKLRRMLKEMRSDDYSSHTGTLGREDEIIEVQARRAEEEKRARV